MKRLITAIFTLILVLVLGACAGVGGNADTQAIATSTPIPTAPAAARPTYVVQRGTVQESLEFSGRWLPRDQLEISFEIAGTVRQVNVRRNDIVSAGTLLVDYQISTLENNLASAQLSLETALINLNSAGDNSEQSVINDQFSLANARLNLENTRNSAPWTNLQSAAASLESAQTNLDNALRDYNEAIGNPDSPSSAASVDAAYQSMQNAQTNLITAQASYYSAAQTFNNYSITIAQAENSVLQNEISLENTLTGGDNPELVQAVNQAQLNIDQINAQIAQSSLYAPIDGVILEVAIQPGDSVQAYTSVITIAIPEPKEAIANLAFNDSQGLSVGMLGTCSVMNQPETAVQCLVRQIPYSNQDADQTTRVAATLPEIAMGQLIEVDMPLEVRENTLWLPPSTIRTFQNRDFVVVQTADGERVVDVELGLETDDRVEILSGLAEGDVVVAP